MRIYLAGPFFSQRERDYQKAVGFALAEAGHELIDPRRHGKADLSSVDDRRRILAANKLDIVESDVVVALLSRRLDDKQTLRLCEDSHFLCQPVPTSDPIHIPDTGTVWEVGFAVAVGKPVWALCDDKTTLNVMLTESVNAVFEEPQDVLAALQLYGSDNVRVVGRPLHTNMEEKGDA